MSSMAPFLDAMGRASEMKAQAAMTNNALASRERESLTDNAFGLINTAMLNQGAFKRQELANKGALDQQKLANEGRLAEIEATKNMNLAVNKALWHMGQETKIVDAYMQLADDYSSGAVSEAGATMNQIITYPALLGQVTADKQALATATANFSMAKTDKELAERTLAIRNALSTRYATLTNYSKMAELQAPGLASKITAAAGANPTPEGIIAATRQVLLDPNNPAFAGMNRATLFTSYLDGVLPGADGSAPNTAKSGQLAMDMQNGIGVDGATYVTELLKRTMMKVGENTSANATDAALAAGTMPTNAALDVGRQVVGRVLGPAMMLSAINGNDIEVTRLGLGKLDKVLTEGPGGSAINVPAMRDEMFYGALSTISGGNAAQMNQWLNTADPNTPGARGIAARIGDSAARFTSTQPANFEELASRGQAASKGRVAVDTLQESARMGRDILQQTTARQVTNTTNAARINFATKARMLQRMMTALNGDTGMQDPQLPADLEKMAQEGYEAAARIGADSPAAKTWRDVDTQVRAEWQKAQQARTAQQVQAQAQAQPTPQPQPQQMPSVQPATPQPTTRPAGPQWPAGPGGLPSNAQIMDPRNPNRQGDAQLRRDAFLSHPGAGYHPGLEGYSLGGTPQPANAVAQPNMAAGAVASWLKGNIKPQPQAAPKPQQTSQAPVAAPFNIAAPLPGGGPMGANDRAAMMVASQAAQRNASRIKITIDPIMPGRTA